MQRAPVQTSYIHFAAMLKTKKARNTPWKTIAFGTVNRTGVQKHVPRLQTASLIVLHVFLSEWRSPRSARLLSGSSTSPPYRNGFFSWWVNPFIFSCSKLISVKCVKGLFFFSSLLFLPTCYSQQYWKQQASDHRPSGPEHPDHLTLFCGDSWQPLHTGVWLLGQELSCVLLGDR